MTKYYTLEQLEEISSDELEDILIDSANVGYYEFLQSAFYIQRLIKTGVDLNTVLNSDGQTLMHITSDYGNIRILHDLISDGANLGVLDHHGFTPLHWAIDSANVKFCEILLQAGADVNNIGSHNWKFSPLHHAVFIENLEITKLLLSSGANKNALDSSNHSPWNMSTDYIREGVPQLNPDYNG